MLMSAKFLMLICSEGFGFKMLKLREVYMCPVKVWQCENEVIRNRSYILQDLSGSYRKLLLSIILINSDFDLWVL